ncbi:MAG: hypothetical protein JNK07_07625 [Alphaproteobacteria bacterium]|nr:hypothetical protein [Alphaproteobacteria bacterium]
MRSWLFLGFAISVLAASGALAEETPSSPPAENQQQPPQSQQATVPPATDSDSDREKVICKKVDVPGTRIGGKKVCKTKREWDEVRRDTSDAVRRSQDAALRSNPSSGGGN